MAQGRGVIRAALAFILLLGSLALVVWRQSKALDTLRALEEVEREHVRLEAERGELIQRIQRLESRGRVVEASARLGLRVPTSGELVILPARSGPVGESEPVGEGVR